MIYGLPKTVVIEDDEIRNALADCVNSIVRAIRVALEAHPQSFLVISASAASS